MTQREDSCGGDGRKGSTTNGRPKLGDGERGDCDRYDGSNTTGFVSPAGDALEGPIDLSLLLDLHRPHRYPVRVLGDALAERGILPGDILIADTATAPTHGRVAIVMLHGEVWVASSPSAEANGGCVPPSPAGP